MRHLITGGAGFIGSHLADRLAARGDAIVLLDDLSTGRRANVEPLPPGIELVEGSACDAELVDALVRRVDCVWHLAAAVGVRLVVSDPLESLLSNVRGADVVLNAAARHGRTLLYSSTSEVYGKNAADALSEDADRVLGPTQRTRWAYATAKAFGESLAHGLHRDRGARCVTVRLFNVVGPRQTGQYGMVLPRFVDQALARRALTVYGDGTQTRCFAHVDDVIDALVALHDEPAAVGGVFNVGGSSELSIRELAERVLERSGSGSAITLVPYEQAYGDGFEELGRRRPDTSRLRALTGWAPRRTIDDAIDDVIAHEQRRREPLAS